MITDLEQKQLRDLFKGHYTNDILKILNAKKIKNRNGNPHNAQYVRMVFQGIRNNADVEDAIWKFASIKKKQFEFQKLEKQKILKNLKR
ncbi:hypothetical protein [Polaribacter cellanae]|uniref:Uncharacterized protein n=1 Tax=Polaribacter cellanae TaxID=2818493 RepID=A0A975CQS1_9FLAO|nr:hypothetical protein [Polaribacter cellanae]QTE23913.1 hypothetical protein J3359_06485 [Polaribacter cellanae]